LDRELLFKRSRIMKSENLVQEKSYRFALRIISLYKYLVAHGEFVLSKQILRSGTSIGANVEEAIGCHSSKDFLAKFSIVYKEARETHYWLRLLKDSRYLDEKQAGSMLTDCDRLLRIIGSIQKTLKSKQSIIRIP
jgi:four helix bundle protein